MKKYLLIGFIVICVILAGLGVYMGFNADMRMEETEVSLSSITSAGELSVLSAQVNILSSLFVGPSSNPDYARLYNQKGTAKYSVDLGKIEIVEGVNSNQEKILFIRLPEPHVDLYVDASTGQTLGEFQTHSWSGDAETGYNAFVAKNEEGYKKMLESLQGSEGLMLEAKNSAIDRVRELIDALALNYSRCEIYFSE